MFLFIARESFTSWNATPLGHTTAYWNTPADWHTPADRNTPATHHSSPPYHPDETLVPGACQPAKTGKLREPSEGNATLPRCVEKRKSQFNLSLTFTYLQGNKIRGCLRIWKTRKSQGILWNWIKSQGIFLEVQWKLLIERDLNCAADLILGRESPKFVRDFFFLSDRVDTLKKSFFNRFCVEGMLEEIIFLNLKILAPFLSTDLWLGKARRLKKRFFLADSWNKYFFSFFSFSYYIFRVRSMGCGILRYIGCWFCG